MVGSPTVMTLCSAAVVVLSLETAVVLRTGVLLERVASLRTHAHAKPSVADFLLLIFLLLFASSISAAQGAPGSVGNDAGATACPRCRCCCEKQHPFPPLLFFVHFCVEDHPPRIHVAVCCCCAWSRCHVGAGVSVSVRGEPKAVSVARHRCQSARP